MSTVSEAVKTCGKCGETKALSEFSRDRRSKDGLQSSCRPCQNAAAKAYREANPEYLRKWQETNRENQRAYFKARNAVMRLRTLEALEDLARSPPTPSDAEILSSLSGAYTRDISPTCKMADQLLSLAECGGEEHEAKAALLAEVTQEWLSHQRQYQLKTIEEYENEYPDNTSPRR